MQLEPYGRSKTGVELTEEVLDRMAEDAEAGLDVTRLRRRPGPPWDQHQRKPCRFAWTLSCAWR